MITFPHSQLKGSCQWCFGPASRTTFLKIPKQGWVGVKQIAISSLQLALSTQVTHHLKEH